MISAQVEVVIYGFDDSTSEYVTELAKSGMRAEGTTNALDIVTWRNAAKALVVVVTGLHQVRAVGEFLVDRWKDIVDCGAHVIVAVPLDDVAVYADWHTNHWKLDGSKTGSLEESFVRVVPADPRNVANTVMLLRRQRVAPEPFDIRNPPAGLSASHRRLLERAFGEYASVNLEVLDPGATATVFRADAGRSGNRPLPFIVKIGTREKIIEEYDNFLTNVRDLVPFSSRPSLIEARCLVGADAGILIGQFIEDSEPLASAIQRGAAQGLVHAVFDNVLRGWWRREDRATKIEDRAVTQGLDSWYSPRKSERRGAMMHHFGVIPVRGRPIIRDPSALGTKLSARGKSVHLRSLVHGDLHARNLQVRGNEVFLIDFGSVMEGPLLADPAMLEASIVMEVGIGCRKNGLGDLWKAAIADHLYPAGWDTHRHTPTLDHSMESLIRRMCSAVQVVRMHAFSVELADGDYRAVLAAAFLRLCCFVGDSDRVAVISRLYEVANGLI